MVMETLTNRETVVKFNSLEGVNLPDNFRVKEVRENLETLSQKKGGQIFQVYYLKEDTRPRFTRKVAKVQRFTFQKADYEARQAVKDVRAAGKEADLTNKKNETLLDGDIHLSYNEKTGKYKIGFPTASQQGKPVTIYFLDNKEVSKDEYDNYVNSCYSPKKYGEFVQSYFSLNVENILCIN